jgi:hypothetical protein
MTVQVVHFGRLRRRVGAAVALLAAVPTILVASPSAVSVAAPAPAPVVSEALEASDEQSASLLAYRTRKPVTVTGLTTETSQTVALPDGSFQATMHLAPARMRDDAGEWVDVDLTLERRPDGSVAPRAHPRGLWLSGARSAGSSALAAVGYGGERTMLGWRGALPEPVLEGNKATYPGVRPGVDLVVEARRTGYEYFVVAKDRSAADDVALLAMPWDTGALTAAVRPSGGLELRSGSGAVVEVPPAEMWDATRSPLGEPVRRAPVALSTRGVGAATELVVEPDQGFLADPSTTYPVTIDPYVNLEPAFDAYVQDTAGNTDKSGDSDLRLGFTDDAAKGCASGCTARSFLSFHNLSGYWDATVVSAELLLWNFHSHSCTEAKWEAWRVDYVDSTARWGNQPGWIEQLGTSMGTKGYSSGCAAGRVSVQVGKAFQASFNGHWNTANIGLRATSESNHNGWKKFNSTEAADHGPYVVLLYNRKPSVPTGLQVDSCYSVCASPAVVRSGQPQVSALVSDPDGGTLRVEYEVWDEAKAVRKAASVTAVTGVASGTRRPWRVTPNLLDGIYHWRVRACDGYDCSPSWSGWFTFTVDTDAPSLPYVNSVLYDEKSTGFWNGSPGFAGTFEFATSAWDVQEYIYHLNGQNPVTVPAGSPSAEMLTANQQQVSTDLTGFTAGANAVNSRVSNLGHLTSESLQVAAAASGNSDGAQGDTYATVGGDYGGLRLGMQPGRRYVVSGWVRVPAATGLNPSGTYGSARGQRIVVFYKTGTSYVTVVSPQATVVDEWQKLSVVVTLPDTATEAFVRLYNGSPTGSGKSVYWDDLSVRQLSGTWTFVDIAPDRDGTNVLQVQARDRAGFTSDPRVYQFLVKPSADTWNWTLDETAGMTAQSQPDNTRPATYNGTGEPWTTPGHVGDAAVGLDGTAELTTASPVLNTVHASGFTVAAYVRLTDLTTSRTAVSQDGTTTSRFRLGFRTDHDVNDDEIPDPAWCFTVAYSDAAAPTEAAACTTNYVVVGDWVSLVGIYDTSTQKAKLYVNGTPDVGGAYAEASFGGGWSASGPFAIGRGWSGGPAQRWVGQLDHVYAAQQVWDDEEIVGFHLLGN